MPTLRRPLPRALLRGLPFLLLWLPLFWPTWRWMAERFAAHDSFYSHGWLVPLASAWLVWQRRQILQRLPQRPSAAGLGLLIPALAIHVLASWWQVGFASGLAMVAALWGLVWTLWGGRVIWALRFPLLFLLFMVPLPGVLLIATSFRMKLVAATLATHALRLLGLSAVQAGSTIHLPGVSVIVDDTCSGLRSLISLGALAILWTSWMPAKSRTWQKVAVCAASMPIALVANMVRILVLVLLAAIYGPEAAEGFIHYGSGIVVFGLSVILLMWLSRRLAPSSYAVTG
ncbi:MAG: exosortase/archaeosortase family protein [Candidatus Omnitrophica bacterium]|nr:exosortase/archaeosortase family protein [Candidatus Omnitrophota bacterium]